MPDTRTGLTTAADIIDTFDQLRELEHDITADGQDRYDAFLASLDAKHGDDAELMLLRDLLDLVRPVAYRVDTDEIGQLVTQLVDDELAIENQLVAAGIRVRCPECRWLSLPGVRCDNCHVVAFTDDEAKLIATLPFPAGTEFFDATTGVAHADNGYDWIERMNGIGWAALPDWGQQGWDLGEWPVDCVCIYTRRDEDHGPNLFAVARRIEGDLTVRAFTSYQDRCDYIDQVAVSSWKMTGSPDLSNGVHEVHRGPFGKGRHDWTPGDTAPLYR